MLSNFVCFLVFFFFSVIIRTRLECSIPKDHYINLVSPAVPLSGQIPLDEKAIQMALV